MHEHAVRSRDSLAVFTGDLADVETGAPLGTGDLRSLDAADVVGLLASSVAVTVNVAAAASWLPADTLRV